MADEENVNLAEKEEDIIDLEVEKEELTDNNQVILSKLKNLLTTIVAFILVIWDFFMNSAFLRNIVSFFLDLCAIYIAGMGILYCWSEASEKNAIYWWSCIGFLVGSFIIFTIAIRLGVTRVCPNCEENRAIKISENPTGNMQYGAVRSVKKGDVNVFEQEVREEYIRTRECIFGCGYCETETFWKSKWNSIQQ